MQQLIALSMKTAGFDVVGTGANGEEGVNLFKELKPDITLLDIEMPVMSGIKALGQIMETDPDAFVVMLTSVDNMDVVDDCLDTGAFDYVTKDNMQEIGILMKEAWAEFTEE